MNSPRTFVFYGPPGSGKGTQVELLKKYLKEKNPNREVLHISTGEILRRIIKENNSQTIKKTADVMAKGELLEVFVPIWAWTNFLIENFTGDEHLIFDGVARRAEEMPVLDGALKFYERKDCFIVYINVSDDVAEERLLKRRRNDDNRDEIKKRLNWFNNEVKPHLEYYKNRKDYYDFLDVDGERSIEEISQDIISRIN